jgi:hypothetical protein
MAAKGLHPTRWPGSHPLVQPRIQHRTESYCTVQRKFFSHICSRSVTLRESSRALSRVLSCHAMHDLNDDYVVWTVLCLNREKFATGVKTMGCYLPRADAAWMRHMFREHSRLRLRTCAKKKFGSTNAITVVCIWAAGMAGPLQLSSLYKSCFPEAFSLFKSQCWNPSWPLFSCVAIPLNCGGYLHLVCFICY